MSSVFDDDQIQAFAADAVRRIRRADIRDRKRSARILLGLAPDSGGRFIDPRDQQFRRNKLIPGISIFPAFVAAEMARASLLSALAHAKRSPLDASPARIHALRDLLLALRYERRWRRVEQKAAA